MHYWELLLLKFRCSQFVEVFLEVHIEDICRYWKSLQIFKRTLTAVLSTEIFIWCWKIDLMRNLVIWKQLIHIRLVAHIEPLKLANKILVWSICVRVACYIIVTWISPLCIDSFPIIDIFWLEISFLISIFFIPLLLLKLICKLLISFINIFVCKILLTHFLLLSFTN